MDLLKCGRALLFPTRIRFMEGKDKMDPGIDSCMQITVAQIVPKPSGLVNDISRRLLPSNGKDATQCYTKAYSTDT